MKNKSLIITIIVGLALGGIGFFGGIKYEQSKVPSFARNFNGQRMGVNGNGANRATGSRSVTGEILSTDDKSVTVKLTDGSSKIVLLSDSTQINEATTAAKTDLKVGTKVAAFGTQNSDGSVTAQSIQINPQTPMRPNQPQEQ